MYLVNESSKLESVNRVHEIGEKSHSLLDHPRISVERCICTFDNSESYFAWYKECAQSTDNLPLEGSHRNNFVWSMT